MNDGIYVYEIDDLGYDMADFSEYTMGSILFQNNTIVAESDGIYIEYLTQIGYDMTENASHTMEDIIFVLEMIFFHVALGEIK